MSFRKNDDKHTAQVVYLCKLNLLKTTFAKISYEQFVR